MFLMEALFQFIDAVFIKHASGYRIRKLHGELITLVNVAKSGSANKRSVFSSNAFVAKPRDRTRFETGKHAIQFGEIVAALRLHHCLYEVGLQIGGEKAKRR